MQIGTCKIHSEEIYLESHANLHLFDITNQLQKFVFDSQIIEGRLTVFIPGATASVLTVENEEGLIQDLKDFIKHIVPKDGLYKHNIIDDNAHSHLRATLFGAEITIPVINRKMTLGTWQQIFIADFDTPPRHRKIVLQIMGI